MTDEKIEPGERTLICFGDKTFRITVPAGARVTYGPWAPPAKDGRYSHEALRGTLRIYSPGSKDDCIFVQSGVTGYRDQTIIHYEEKEASVEVKSAWRSDRHGYRVETEERRDHQWVNPELPEHDDDAC